MSKRPDVGYYRERNGDYLSVAFCNGGRSCGTGYLWDARGAAIAGDPSSVQGTSASTGHLRTCRKVRREDVPKEWHLVHWD